MKMQKPPRCQCIDPLFFADDPNHCFRCGRGPCAYTTKPSRRTQRLPRDLGAIAREGRRPSLRLDNVVRLDKLRPERTTMPTPPGTDLTRREFEVLGLLADGGSAAA